MKLSMILSQLSTGMAGTISIFVLTLVFSLPLGLLIAFGRMSKNRIMSGIFRLYISLMRGTPLMLQLMVVYFGPFYLFGMNIGKWRFPAIITGFALNYGAYFAEIYRSGHRFDGSWTVRGSKASWLFEGTDVCPHYSASGCETDSAGDHQ